MGKKTLGVTSTKRPKSAGNFTRTSAITGLARLLTSDVEVAVSPLDEGTQKIDVLGTILRDLSIRIKVTKTI